MQRRGFLALCASVGASATLAEGVWQQVEAVDAGALASSIVPASAITRDMIRSAQSMLGVTYSESECELMVDVLESYLASYLALRTIEVPNHVLPAIRFSAILPGRSYAGSHRATNVAPTSRVAVARPASAPDLAFLNAVQLAELLRTREVTASELTRLYLDRLRAYNDELKVVVNYTEERALKQAAEADREIAAGRYRGPLHGIPYGVKDSLAVAGYPTTWGAAQFRDRVINTTATVVQKLDAAGAVLIAKLSMGELGLSDRWFGGRTMSPWKPSEGALGSSAGSAAATAAGLVAFAIGEETMGSIVLPSTRNAVTGLRPTFGRVSRAGGLTLCWTLDKLGPMGRCVEDCAMVLETIAGRDLHGVIDPTVESIPYAWDPSRDPRSVRVGYARAEFEKPRPGVDRDAAVLEELSASGIDALPVDLPADMPINAMLFVRVEAVAALHELERTGGLHLLKEQHGDAWPSFIRSGRFVPAFEYLQANRVRTQLMERMDTLFQEVDVIVAPTESVMVLTDLTGHPCIVAPNGFTADGEPTSITFVGKPFGEAELCAVARVWQDNTPWNKMHPVPFAAGPN